jgi:hypothetical protein
MQTTPRLGLRVPDGTIDSPDVPLWMLRIAQDLETSLQVGLFDDRPAAGHAGRHYFASDTRVEYVDTASTWETVGQNARRTVTVLPASGQYPGEEIYLAVTNAGLPGGPERWLLRYDDTRAGSYKWEVISAKPLIAAVETAESTTSTAVVDLATTGPTLTMPAAGAYDFDIGATAYNANVSGGALIQLYKNAAIATPIAYVGTMGGSANNVQVTVRRQVPNVTVATGDALKLRYSVNNLGTASFLGRVLSAAPRWVGP